MQVEEASVAVIRELVAASKTIVSFSVEVQPRSPQTESSFLTTYWSEST
jgi:hypothetical protein